ncbi:sushi, von Willebrand factor type A, EGF and pentraxin domain-containing protein 1-like [Branchiostoma lanceolatum]|uniref:sushi, von Willebrand factor type A, EGF and pentraxin domain-containing protein 1-like n=1 Tax=Branchiostoma lanceolatum TaxID=7740 RepID=UPI003453B866
MKLFVLFMMALVLLDQTTLSAKRGKGWMTKRGKRGKGWGSIVDTVVDTVGGTLGIGIRRRTSGGGGYYPSCTAVNCQWGQFKKEGDCSSRCGAMGQQLEVREVSQHARCDGAPCEGSAFRHTTCRPDPICYNGGTWTGSACRCPPGFKDNCCENTVFCPQLDSPQHGTLSPQSTMSQGTSVTYICVAGYVLKGSRVRTCNNGIWTGTTPYCERAACPTLSAVDNGVLYGGTLYGDTLHVVCDPGHEIDQTRASDIYQQHMYMVGNSTAQDARAATSFALTCQADSTWGSDEPSCKVTQCSPLAPPNHGTSSGGNSYLDTVTFICDAGYEIRGSHTRTCLADGTWTGIQPDCVLKQCACLEAPPFGSIAVSGGCDVSDTVTFSCNSGYELQGSVSRSCQTTQQWTGSQPFCVKIQCPPLNAPANGMKFGGNEYQETVSFTCSTGYEIVGTSTLTCQADQTWSDTVPACIRSQCPVPQAPPNGDVTGSNEYGNTVTFGCEVGYRLEGSPTRTCMATKTWSGIETSCVLKTCPPAHAPGHGSVSGGNSYGDTVTYSCETGYDMLGTPTRTCQDSQQWSGNQPYCLKVECNTLNPPTAGFVVGGHEYGESVQFSCWPGHTLTGSGNRTCQEDGQWSGQQPICVENECPELDSPPNGYKTGGNGYGDIVIFFCNDGYEMDGPEPVVIRTCEADRTRRACPRLLPPANGNITGNNLYGDVVTITCGPGYGLRGSSTRACQANQQWNGTSPTCERLQCPILSAISDGQISGNNLFGDRTTFVCNTGYELTGSQSRTCQADGSWTGTQAACNRKQCPDLSPPLNGNVTGQTFYGDTVIYTCSEGYELTGITARICQADQQWSGTEPICQKMKCPMFDPPPNGGVNGTNHYGDIVVFDCNIGYELVGSQQRTCQSSQQWSGTQPYCERKQCPQLTVPAHGSANGGIYNGDTAAYSCDPGYALMGSSIRTCQADGQWGGMQPTCNKKQCLLLQAPTNGSITGGNFYGEQVFYSCDSGFDLVGTPIRICEANQQWSGTQPSCTKKQCSVLIPPAHGSLAGTGVFTFGEAVTFSCDPGYDIQGSGTRVCQATGQWSGTPAQCQKKCCDRPAIQNGDYAGTHCYDDTVAFMCDVGYRLLGATSLRCTESAQWSSSLPVCERICCASTISIPNGSVSFLPDNCHGGVADFRCEQGFYLEGSNLAICNNTGLWAGQLPSCERVCCGAPGTIRDGVGNSTGLCYGDVTTYTCTPGFILKGNATVVCDDLGYWGKAPYCEPNSLCDRTTLAVPSAGSKICFENPHGTAPVEYCQMHCNAPNVYNRNDKMYECSVETSWLWMVRVHHAGGQQVLFSVDVGECSGNHPPLDPFAAITIGGLVITAHAPLDMAVIEDEMKQLLHKTMPSTRRKIGQISVDVSPTARVGPLLKQKSTSVQYQVSIQLLAYADPNLVTPTNTIQMEWVRLAGELGQVASTLETMVVSHSLNFPIAGSHMSIVPGGLHISSPSLGCMNGEIKEGIECVPCGSGTYHDVFEQTCRACSYATYQDEFGQTECKSCPNGTTTAKSGAKNVTECKVYDDCDCGIHPCEMTPDGYACSCLPGYEMYGVSAENETCIDIDECEQPDVCPGARCINRPGTAYSCQCLPGYEEPSCIDINECRYAGFCPETSDCTNTEGSYYCTCHPGFHGEDCLDINECQNATLNNCGSDQHCVNTKGFYTCLSE